MSIGVYGHPSHEISKYTLLVSELIIEDDTIPYDQTSRSSYKDRDKVSGHINYYFYIFILYKDIYFNYFS